jgi:hypothetical protein
MRFAACSLLLAGLVAACGGVTIDPPSGTTSSSTGAGPACEAAKADCDHDGTCETKLGTLDNCGACGDVCGGENGVASCNAGHCEIVCSPGFADCNGDPTDGCEVQLSADPEHCGMCETSCGSGDCFLGTCATVVAATLGVDGIVARSGSIYWSALDVYAGPNGLVAKSPAVGGVATPLVTGQSAPNYLHAAGDLLVWSDSSTHAIYRMALPAGDAEVVYEASASDAPPRVLDADADQVYFTTGTEVAHVAAIGGPPSIVATGFASVSAAKVVGSDVYVADLGADTMDEVDGELVPGHSAGRIVRVSPSSNTAVTIASAVDTPSAIAADTDSLYWAAAGSRATYDVDNTSVNRGTLGRIVRSGLGGENPITLADSLVKPNAIVLDGGYLYWSEGGTVGGIDPADISFTSDGGVKRILLSGGSAAETIMPAVDASNLAVSNDGVFFSSWTYGVVLGK